MCHREVLGRSVILSKAIEALTHSTEGRHWVNNEAMSTVIINSTDGKIARVVNATNDGSVLQTRLIVKCHTKASCKGRPCWERMPFLRKMAWISNPAQTALSALECFTWKPKLLELDIILFANFPEQNTALFSPCWAATGATSQLFQMICWFRSCKSGPPGQPWPRPHDKNNLLQKNVWNNNLQIKSMWNKRMQNLFWTKICKKKFEKFAN